ncbi:hypothetical protein DL98DRAFT_528385 [Cadophora sp. DSE1049]|nr:hypothetical protein DL98DRAFT_528385 [Cadophora sp. DSE1049]
MSSHQYSIKMKKFIHEKSIPTVAVSLPKSGNDGGFVTFLHEKAGSFRMACSLPKKKQYADVKIEGWKPKLNTNTNNKGNGKGKTGLDTMDEEEEAGPTESGAQAKTGGSKSFEDDEEKMDKMHQEAKRRYITLKKEELLLMDKELEALNRDIEELTRKEKEEIRNMEGLMREFERRKEGSGKGKGKGKVIEGDLE